MRRVRDLPAALRPPVPRGGAISSLWVLGLTLLTPVIALAGLLALIGVTVAGTIRLVRTTVPQTGRTTHATQGQSTVSRPVAA